ncbi:MAG: IPT/TIG domain-containing protein, partial [Bacteroidota bacterium]
MKFLNAYDTKKWLLFGLPVLVMCLIMACSNDDGKTDDTTDDITGGDDDVNPPTMTFTGFSPEEGERGTNVQLSGTHFSTTASENTVKFGNVDAEVTDAKANQLNVTVP